MTTKLLVSISIDSNVVQKLNLCLQYTVQQWLRIATAQFVNIARDNFLQATSFLNFFDS